MDKEHNQTNWDGNLDRGYKGKYEDDRPVCELYTWPMDCAEDCPWWNGKECGRER